MSQARPGVARIEGDYGGNPRGVYLIFAVQIYTDSEIDGKLEMESFPTFEEALAGDYSGKSVSFRGELCQGGAPYC